MAFARSGRHIGFFTITGHGVAPAAMDSLREKAHAFFALTPSEKRRAIHPVPATPRGYIALGIEALSYGNDRATPPDLKEYYHFGRDSWPNEPYYTCAPARAIGSRSRPSPGISW